MNFSLFFCMKLADDKPSTSAQPQKTSPQKVSPEWKFQKFRDDLSKNNRRLTNRKLKRLNSTSQTSVGQILTKKLLRSIKRRQIQNDTPQNPRNCLRRRLNFAANEKTMLQKTALEAVQKKSKPQRIECTLEEGEIITEDDITIGTAETVVAAAATAAIRIDDDTNDCICIEPVIEQIVIHDDEPSSSGYTASASKLLDKTVNKSIINIGDFMTSTPYAKVNVTTTTATTTKPTSTAAATSNNEMIENKPFFFEDTTRRAWYETIKSDDNFLNYTTMSLLHEVNEPKRRSSRLKNKDLGITLPDEIIVLDETYADETLMKSTKRQRHHNNTTGVDDSVVFVSETNPETYIPLMSDIVPNPAKKLRYATTPPAKPKRAAHNELFTTSDRKQLEAYNNNAYNPDAGNTPEQQTKKRLIIIDGSNVAYHHALNQIFSVKGLQICIEYFEKIGHEVKVVVPQFRLQKFKSSSPEDLEKMHRAGKIVFTPCKNLPGIHASSYDDRFILQLACELDAAVISNDNYRDLLNENTAFKKVIENRVVGYTWCNDIFILPKDPYGKWGPSLQTILNRT